MSPTAHRLLLAGLVAGWIGPALAETLRCQSINGNVTCAGSGAVSCQTVNGRTTCVSGGIVQEFGGGRMTPPPPEPHEPPDAAPDAEPDEPPAYRRPGGRLSIERHGPAGWLSLQRDGSRLRLRTDRLALDRD